MQPTDLLALLALDRPLVIGHRGICALAPENTLASFQLAIDAGVDLVELDYRQTRDGVLVVIHDPDLDRTTDATARWGKRRIKVRTRTAAEIRTLDAGAWFHPKYAGAKVPLLTEALEAIAKRSFALIERKDGTVDDSIRALRELSLSPSEGEREGERGSAIGTFPTLPSASERVIVQSFDWSFLRDFHEHAPAQLLAALGPPSVLANGRRPRRIRKHLSSAWLDEAEKTGAKIVVWNRRVSANAVRSAHNRGLKVWIYTIDEPSLAKRLVAIGVDGIITNAPVAIRQALNQPCTTNL